MGETIVDYVRKRIVIYAIVVSILALGMAAGGIAVGVMDAASRDELAAFLGGYVGELADGAGALASEPTAITLEVLRGVGIPWLLGLTIIGGPLVLALIFLRGFALGFTLVFLFERLAYKGILLAVAGILPHAIFTIPALVMAGGAAITFSLVAAKVLAGRRSEGQILGHFVVASLLCACAAILIAAGAWVQSNLSPILVQTVARYVSFTL